jgi:hypothetical protein
MGDVPALIKAIRKDERVTRSDDETIDFMADAMMEEWNAQQGLDRLVQSS